MSHPFTAETLLQGESVGFSADEPICKRRSFRLPDMTAEPTVRPFPGDDDAVAVSLFGKYGEGKEMILDRGTWEDISTRFTRKWTVHCRNTAADWSYVCSGQWAAGRAAGQNGPVPILHLSRYIVQAGRYESVIYRNGNRLDLRRCNLLVSSRRELFRRQVLQRQHPDNTGGGA